MTKAFLVGAGPGDPKLLTLSAVDALRASDVVLCDRLVHPEILAHTKATATSIFVGKEYGRQEEIQNEIYAYFEQFAGRDLVLTRLKGGDPYVFGRGAEEYLRLVELGFDVQVIPGISSCIGVPGLASIPLTVRGVSRGFAVVTGHCAGDDSLDWSAYSRIDTLVILMGVKERCRIARNLIDSGRAADEPMAFIENGSLSDEKIILCTLSEVASGGVSVRSPAVAIVGAAVRFHIQLQASAIQLQNEQQMVDVLLRHCA